ncbi:zinc-binding dehydrogenase [Castellaniella sp. WN]
MTSVYGAVVNRYGPDCDVAWKPVQLDAPAPDSVLMRVEAASVNYADYLMVCGKYQVRPDLPFVPGKSLIGVVEGVGADVRDVSAGSVALAWVTQGAFQTRVLVPRHRVFPVDCDVLDRAVVVGGFLSHLTAAIAVDIRGRVGPGDAVLITGAAGDVGRAAVHRARAAGARRVIGVVSGRGREARSGGAMPDETLYASDGNIREHILAMTSGAGVDVAIDLVGGDVFDDVRRSLAWNGRLVVVGFAGGAIPKLALNYVLLKGLTVTGFQLGDYLDREPEIVSASVAAYIDDLRAGRFRVPVAARLPLPDAARALHRVAEGGFVGKIVLTA